MKVLILNGPAEAGKGTVVEFIRKIFDFNVVEYSSIDYVKEVASRDFGWNGVKDEAGRNLLAGIKQVMIAYNDMPMRKIIETIGECIKGKVDILVVDIREPEEISKLSSYCLNTWITHHTCRVINTKAENKVEKSNLSLTGDRLYGEYDYDLYINNDGTLAELEFQVSEIFEEIY